MRATGVENYGFLGKETPCKCSAGAKVSAMAQFTIHRNPQPVADDKRAEIVANPVFGTTFTDHMALMDFTEGTGWHDPRIQAYAPLTLEPAASALHYGQEIFEGLKAYKHTDGSIWLFRPEKNAARFANSARRLLMDPIPVEVFLAAVRELVELDQAWVPDPAGEQSLYLRPFMFANESYLGVREAHRYLFAVIASPAGAYYPAPVRLWVTSKYKRAAGTGKAKCGGNYAASLLAAKEASALGCGQVLYTDAAENRWIEECGTMNFMVITADGQLLTPAQGNILDGVTRDSLLKLAPEHDLEPVERPISTDELFEGLDSGQIVEAFACGTAAIITPIVGFTTSDRGDDTVGDGNPGEKTKQLREHLMGIQYGHTEDTHGWMQRVV